MILGGGNKYPRGYTAIAAAAAAAAAGGKIIIIKIYTSFSKKARQYKSYTPKI